MGGIFYKCFPWHQKRTLTQWALKAFRYRRVPLGPEVKGPLQGINSGHFRTSSGWKDSHIDFELDMEQSVKRGTPIPQVSW